MAEKPNEAENQEVEGEEIEVEVPETDTPDEAPIAPDPADKPAKPEQPKRQDVELPVRDAPPQPKTAQAHDDDDDDASLSEKVRKRIGKLTYKQRQAEREAAEYRERYEALTREREEERRKYETQRVQSDDLIISAREEAINGELWKANQEYIAAYNSGVPEELIKAQSRIAELTYSKRELDLVKQRREASAAREAAAPRQEAPQNTQGGYSPEELQRYRVSAERLSTDYIAQYQNWWDKDEVLTSAVLGIDKKLKAEGDLKPWEPAFYEELDKRLRKRFPTEFADEADDAPTPPAPMVQRPSQPVAGVSRGTGSGKVKVRLSPEDIAYCDKWHIDQNRYAKEKHALEGKSR